MNIKKFYLKFGISTAILLSVGLTSGISAFAADSATSGSTPTSLNIKTMVLPSDPAGSKTGPEGTDPHKIPENTDFALLFTPTKFDFGELTGVTSGNINASLKHDQYIGVGDLRSDNPGWQLTAQASNLKNTTNGFGLNGDIKMNTAVKHVSYNGTSYTIDSSIPDYAKGQTPSTSGTATLTLGGSAIEIMGAEKGKGNGLWATDMSNINLSSSMNNFTQGTYEGTITWNLNNTPSK